MVPSSRWLLCIAMHDGYDALFCSEHKSRRDHFFSRCRIGKAFLKSFAVFCRGTGWPRATTMSTTLVASTTALPPLGTIPSGQSAPLEIIDAQHHGAWVTITTAIGLTLGLVCLFIRTYVRVMISPPFLRDDIIQAASTVSSAQSLSL